MDGSNPRPCLAQSIGLWGANLGGGKIRNFDSFRGCIPTFLPRSRWNLAWGSGPVPNFTFIGAMCRPCGAINPFWDHWVNAIPEASIKWRKWSGNYSGWSSTKQLSCSNTALKRCATTEILLYKNWTFRTSPENSDRCRPRSRNSPRASSHCDDSTAIGKKVFWHTRLGCCM